MPTFQALTRPGFSLFCLLALAAAAQAQPAKPTKISTDDDAKALLAQPFVTVNGEAQSNARAEVLLREQLARGVADSPALRGAVRQTLIAQAAMAQQARKDGLHKNPLLQAQLELTQQNVLAQAWQQKVLADRSLREEDIKAEYERQRASLGDTDYRLRHLLVKDEATAKSLLDQIKAGAKMADLALDNSQDSETRQRGGLSDWTNVAMLLPALADAVKPLANGQLAAKPVQTDAGWHLLQREESRPFQALSYEQAKQQMQTVLARRLLDQRVKELLDSTKVK